MQASMIAGIVVALIIGLAIGYSIAPSGETTTQQPITTTITNTITQTETKVMVETETVFKTVTNTVTSPITVTRTETVTETMNPMPPLDDLQKGVLLRLKVGTAAGVGISSLGFGKVAVAAQSNLFCIQLGSVLASVLNTNNQTAQIFIVQPGVNEDEVALSIVNGGFKAVVLAYGGNSPAQEIVSGFREMVSSLKDSGFNGAIIVHAAAFAAKALDTSIGDKEICNYLQEQDVYVYLPKPDAGILEIHKVMISENCSVTLEKIGEVGLG